MLKIYDVTDYVSIDGTKWRVVGGYGYHVSDKTPENKLIFDNITFNEAYEYLSSHTLDGMREDTSFITKKPLIYIRYQGAWDSVAYRGFNTISYRREFKENANVSLEWIMKNLSADKAIQYLKDRGMTVCPIMK